jgi:predicted nucleotidyltransferase
MLQLTKKELDQVLEILSFYSKDINEAFIFGSRVKGNNLKYSDVDILIYSDQDIVRDIKDDFMESDFVYKVDIVNMVDLEPKVLHKIMKNTYKIM